MPAKKQPRKQAKQPRQPKRVTRYTHDEVKEPRSPKTGDTVPALRPAPLVSLILTIRGQKVLLDADLAAIYGVPTKALNQAVKRNAARFPEDFAFQISREEWEVLNRSQSVTGSQKHRDPRTLPRVFTEHGAIMF